MARLAKVVDTNAEGSCGEAEIGVPKRWLDDGATVEVVLPMRLRCHHCGGGGCDSCERSGAFRLPENIDDRKFELPLPPSPSALRLSDPVDAGRPQFVILSITVGDATNDVRRLSGTNTNASSARWGLLIAAIVLITAAALFATFWPPAVP